MQMPNLPIVQKVTLQMNLEWHGCRSAPLPSTTPRSFRFLNTPYNHQDLSQQTLDAIDFIRSKPVASADTTIALLCRLAHQSEAAITRADIESIEKQDI